MQTPSFDPNDPRLTAFAFGELDASEVESIEQLLAESEEAREALKEIEETVGLVRNELIAEPASGLTSAQRDAIQNAATAAVAPTADPAVASGPSDSSLVAARAAADATPKRTGLAILASVASAAVVIIGVVINQNPDETSDSSPTSAMVRQAEGQTVAALDGKRNFSNATPAENDSVLEYASVADDAGGFGNATNERQLKLAARNRTDGRPADKQRAQPFQKGMRSVQKDNATVANSGEKKVAGYKQQSPEPTGPPAGIGDNNPGKNFTEKGLIKTKFDEAKSDSARELSVAKKSKPGGLPATNNGKQSRTQPNQPQGQPLSKKPESAKNSAATTNAVRRNRGVDSKNGNGQPVGGGLGGGIPQDGQAQSDGKPSRMVASLDRTKTRDLRGSRKVRTDLVAPIAPESETARSKFGRAAPGNEEFSEIIENQFIVPKGQAAFSTFSVDVDTASYANVRRFLTRDQLPPKDAVRIEELVNYFKYDYKQPAGDEPFSVDVELAKCPWATDHRLARIGLQAKTIAKEKRPRTNLVFLVDESGSMRASNKLPLVKTAMKLLVDELTEDDQFSIVTYSSTIKHRLEVTSGAKKDQIKSVIDKLSAGGSTNGSGGIQKAYDVANKNFLQDSSNRVIICTDGDFNLGISKDDELVEFIKEKAASGVFLSVFGFGMGNLKDGKLEKLADQGNGHYGYVDNAKEAQKVFQDQLMGTLYTVAKDVKLQIDFNFKTVGAYRLIGYENRQLAAQDFNDDTRDAGEIGAGHSVTALYEIVPPDVWAKRPPSPANRSKYQEEPKVRKAANKKYADELFTVRLRFKKPDEEKSELTLDHVVKDLDPKKATRPSDDFMFTSSVAAFGMNLRESKFRGKWNLAEVQETAEGTIGDDPTGIRREFVTLVQKARRLTEPAPSLTLPKVPRVLVGIPKKLDAETARNKATVKGKYRRLLKKIEVVKDVKQFGEFYDYGKWDFTAYSGYADLPVGNWVYVYPHWYIWAEQVKPADK